MIVIKYANDGSLRNYFKSNFKQFKWKIKLEIINDIIGGLYEIHKNDYMHRDFHSDNILQGEISYIADFGLSQNIINEADNGIYRVLPKVLCGKSYTKAADVYSFEIIMTEVTTGKLPYNNIPHNSDLALAICNGLRPKLAKNTPQIYIDLVYKCLDANP